MRSFPIALSAGLCSMLMLSSVVSAQEIKQVRVQFETGREAKLADASVHVVVLMDGETLGRADHVGQGIAFDKFSRSDEFDLKKKGTWSRDELRRTVKAVIHFNAKDDKNWNLRAMTVIVEFDDGRERQYRWIGSRHFRIETDGDDENNIGVELILRSTEKPSIDTRSAQPPRNEIRRKFCKVLVR